MQKARQLPNTFIYSIFLIAAIVFVCLKDFSTAIIFSGIGLAFDPFNQSLAFYKRPVWQRAWLIVHVIGVLTIVVAQILKVLS